MTEVRINKASAKIRLNRRIDEAQHILDSLGRPGAIDSHDRILEVRRNFDEWLAATRDLLGRLFSGNSLMEEYEALGHVPINEDPSWLDEINQIKEHLARMIDWLRNLLARVDEMPQSEKTPY